MGFVCSRLVGQQALESRSGLWLYGAESSFTVWQHGTGCRDVLGSAGAGFFQHTSCDHLELGAEAKHRGSGDLHSLALNLSSALPALLFPFN